MQLEQQRVQLEEQAGALDEAHTRLTQALEAQAVMLTTRGGEAEEALQVCVRIVMVYMQPCFCMCRQWLCIVSSVHAHCTPPQARCAALEAEVTSLQHRLDDALLKAATATAAAHMQQPDDRYE